MVQYIVQKFGGTSVANIDRITHAAHLIKQEVDKGYWPVIVVSAMAGATQSLCTLVQETYPFYDAQEYDVIVSSGEQITAGLLSIVLQSMGLSARSWLGWQIPIVTNNIHGKARIEKIGLHHLFSSFKKKQIPIITGFQAITHDNRITTLGRGGSDSSAVAIAAAVGAKKCDIYTDVDGVYTADPRIVPTAKKIERISYEEMLEFSAQGAKVLHTTSVEIAMKYNLPLHVKSSFQPSSSGTIVTDAFHMSDTLISGIAHSKNEAQITLTGLNDQPDVIFEIFDIFSREHIHIDMIIKNIAATNNKTNMTFTVQKSDLERTIYLLKQKLEENIFDQLSFNAQIAKISVIGVGIRSHTKIAGQIFKALAEKNILTTAISTSEIKISFLIAEEYMELAVRTLHQAFNL